MLAGNGLLLATGFAMFHSLAVAGDGVEPKDVVAGEVGRIECNDTVSGMLDRDQDEADSSGFLVDRYRVDVPLSLVKVVRAASEDFDAELVITNVNFGDVYTDSDGGDGVDSRIALPNLPTGEHEIQVRGAGAGESGGYTLSFICFEFPFRFPIPTGPAESWNYHFLWDGFYVELDERFRPRPTARGLALEIQRGVLFGALYSYDSSGQPIFLTLQSDVVDSTGRVFSGTVFETRSGTDTSPVGSFEISLTAQFNNFVEFTIDVPGLAQNGVTWGRFDFAAPNGLFLLDQSRVHFVVAANDPAEREFLDRMGNTIDFLPTIDPLFANTLIVDTPREGFDARLLIVPGEAGYYIDVFSNDDRGDRLRLEVSGNHRGFVGTAVIFLDDRPGEPVDVVGLVSRFQKSRGRKD